MRALAIAAVLLGVAAGQAGAQVADLVDRSAFRVCADPANRPIAAVWGLSPLQEGLYFQSAVSGEHDVYNAQFVLTFDRQG